MQEIARTVGPIALIAGIGCIVAGAIIYIISTQLATSREEMRKLRVALERDPTPAQLGEAIKLWPEAGKYSPNQQKPELIRRAHEEETKRAQKNEMMKGLSRTMFFVGAFAGALYVASIFLGREPAPEPVPTEPTTMIRTVDRIA